jgi:hypothetical protein
VLLAEIFFEGLFPFFEVCRKVGRSRLTSERGKKDKKDEEE